MRSTGLELAGAWNFRDVAEETGIAPGRLFAIVMLAPELKRIPLIPEPCPSTVRPRRITASDAPALISIATPPGGARTPAIVPSPMIVIALLMTRAP